MGNAAQGMAVDDRAAAIDDHSSTFGRIRGELRDPGGQTYREFRKSLSPRWWVVWGDLAITWICLLATLAGVIAAAATGLWWVYLPAVVVGAVLIGILVHRIGLFVHEGAHGNIAPGRANDLVTNLFAGVLIMFDVRSYRPVHLAHHRHLGTPLDPECTYFRCLDARFIARTLLGLHVFDALRTHSTLAADAAATKVSPVVRTLGVLLHAALCLGLVYFGAWPAAIAWGLGVCSICPLVQSLRQLLEHRSVDARRSVDYGHQDHGTYTRLFDRDPLGQVFSAVGFNRHLLHHWDASVSYTRLGQLARWLETTAAADILAARRTGYAAAVRLLWNR